MPLDPVATGAELPPDDCWLTPAARTAPSTIEGIGLFALEPLVAGTVVARFGGRLVDDAELADLIAATVGSGTYVDTLSIHDGVNLVLPPGVPNHAGNHSCAPCTWWTDPFSVVTRRDVARGEELTLDYATITDDPTFSMTCRCGTERCRGTVTGADWSRPDLRAVYGTHWVPVLRRRIAGGVP